MKLLLFNATARFSAATPEEAPLGGTESCAAYLTRQLAANGHDVTLMAALPPGTPRLLMGVRHLPPEAGTAEFFKAEDFEAVITLASPLNVPALHRAAPRAFHILWLHLLPGQLDTAQAMQAAPFIDCAVLISNFQHANFPFKGAVQVIGNGIAPAFENMFASAADLQAAKRNRAVYTSTPFRGLNILAESFARARIDTRLDVYSGMATHQQNDAQYATLYEKLKATARCHFHGAVGQKALAGALRQAAFLAYPCTFLETYCIAAMEAVAAGLKVVSTAYGALPETTLGFADLMAMPSTPDELVALYTPHLEKNVAAYLVHPEEWAEERYAQSREVNRLCSWRARAREWESFLGPAIAWKRGA